jgi:hypothetical protein
MSEMTSNKPKFEPIKAWLKKQWQQFVRSVKIAGIIIIALMSFLLVWYATSQLGYTVINTTTRHIYENVAEFNLEVHDIIIITSSKPVQASISSWYEFALQKDEVVYKASHDDLPEIVDAEEGVWSLNAKLTPGRYVLKMDTLGYVEFKLVGEGPIETITYRSDRYVPTRNSLLQFFNGGGVLLGLASVVALIYLFRKQFS